jgi:hypothetical protein
MRERYPLEMVNWMMNLDQEDLADLILSAKKMSCDPLMKQLDGVESAQGFRGKITMEEFTQ